MYKFDYNKLRGRIKEKLGTEGRFAEEIGRTKGYVSQVFNHAAYFSQTDIIKAVDVLEIEPVDVGVYFFTVAVHKSGTIQA